MEKVTNRQGCQCPEPQLSHRSSIGPHFEWCILLHPAWAVAGWRTWCIPHIWHALLGLKNPGKTHKMQDIQYGLWHYFITPFSITVLCMFTSDGEVKAAEAVSWERVCTTLKNHSTGLVHLHHLSHHLHNQSRKICDSLSTPLYLSLIV